MIDRPDSTANEPAWSKYIAWLKGGRTEVRTFTGLRCDIVTKDYAIECEWIKKWPEAIGQSLIYSVMLNKKPKIILLARNKPTDEVRYLTCLAVCSKCGIELEVFQTIERN